MQRFFLFRPPAGVFMRAKSNSAAKFATKTVVYCALMTALVTVATVTLGFRTGDFFFNCGDAVIFVTAALLGPLPAAVAGGLGSFFADLAVYPATMFFTLVIKALEGLTCGLFMYAFRKISSGRGRSAVWGALSMTVGGALMMTGYYICNSFFYGTPASALVALPADAVQAAASVALAAAVLYGLGLIKLRDRLGFVKPSVPPAPEYVRMTSGGKDVADRGNNPADD